MRLNKTKNNYSLLLVDIWPMEIIISILEICQNQFKFKWKTPVKFIWDLNFQSCLRWDFSRLDIFGLSTQLGLWTHRRSIFEFKLFSECLIIGVGIKLQKSIYQFWKVFYKLIFLKSVLPGLNLHLDFPLIKSLKFSPKIILKIH